jgi:hypothetical protein
VGNVLLGSKEMVVAIHTVKRRGLYAPVTKSGTIMVSGVAASCYVQLLDHAPWTIQAHASHAALAPLRLACAMNLSLCVNESHSLDGFSTNYSTVISLGLHVSDLSAFYQAILLLALSPVLAGLVVLEKILSTMLILSFCVLAPLGFCYFAVKKKNLVGV